MPRSSAAAAEAPNTTRAQTRRTAPRGRVAPVRSTRRDVVAEDQKVGQDAARELPAEGKARLTPKHFEAVDTVSDEKLALLAFMEEEVTVIVHESTNPTDDPIPEVWNDGIVQRFIRGKEQVVKRKYIEVLARAKVTRYTQEELPNRGGYRNIPHTALRYPFTIVEDSEKGKAWVKRVLAEGQ